jgi:hypothetical protein
MTNEALAAVIERWSGPQRFVPDVACDARGAQRTVRGSVVFSRRSGATGAPASETR